MVSTEEAAATLREANLRIKELEREVKGLREQMESAVEEAKQEISRDRDAVLETSNFKSTQRPPPQN